MRRSRKKIQSRKKNLKQQSENNFKKKGKRNFNRSQKLAKFQKGTKKGTKRRHDKSEGRKKEITFEGLSGEQTVRVFLPPALQSNKISLQTLLAHCDDIVIKPTSLFILKIAEANLEKELADLQELSFEGKKLKVIVSKKPSPHPLKRLVKFPKFGVDLNELKQYYNASSVEHLHTKEPKPFYILNFESEEAANEVWEKKFSFNGRHITPVNYLVLSTNTSDMESKDVTESDRGSVTKKMKKENGAEDSRNSSVIEEKDEDENKNEDEKEDKEGKDENEEEEDMDKEGENEDKEKDMDKEGENENKDKEEEDMDKEGEDENEDKGDEDEDI